MSLDQNAGGRHSVKTDNNSFESVEDFKYVVASHLINHKENITFIILHKLI
jgi:hypothetical protein